MEGKIFFKKEDQEFVASNCELSGVMHGLCDGWLQGKFTATLPQFIKLNKSGRVHMVLYDEYGRRIEEEE